MKKGWKRALSVLLVLMLLVSLSGCDALDMMRQAQAYYGENGEILHNGTTYKRLPEWGDLNPGYGYYDENYVNVTEPDVPVLLSGLICLEELILSNDKNFLISINDNNLYCREELYDSVCERIHQGFAAEVVCYYYYVYDEQTDGMDVQREPVVTDTEEPTDTEDIILNEGQKQTIGGG